MLGREGELAIYHSSIDFVYPLLLLLSEDDKSRVFGIIGATGAALAFVLITTVIIALIINIKRSKKKKQSTVVPD